MGFDLKEKTRLHAVGSQRQQSPSDSDRRNMDDSLRNCERRSEPSLAAGLLRTESSTLGRVPGARQNRPTTSFWNRWEQGCWRLGNVAEERPADHARLFE